MATRLTFEPWNGQPKSLPSWLERLDEHFVMEDVKEPDDDRKMVASLLSFIGEYGYEILKGLSAPAKPSTLKYKEVVKLITEHIAPKRNVMVERYKFNQIIQGSRAVTEYLSDLRKASEHCNFEAFYDHALRDRFVCGLSSDAIRRALLSEDKELSLNDAYLKALAR